MCRVAMAMAAMMMAASAQIRTACDILEVGPIANSDLRGSRGGGGLYLSQEECCQRCLDTPDCGGVVRVNGFCYPKLGTVRLNEGRGVSYMFPDGERPRFVPQPVVDEIGDCDNPACTDAVKSTELLAGSTCGGRME